MNSESLPLISVTMPVYNGERTINLAIQSLLNQTYTNWLCIIVNDCSTDNTRNLLNEYESNPKFKIIHLSKNAGRGNARQVALENAEGDFLAFLDADDLYHPRKLELQVEAFKMHPNLVVCGSLVGSYNLNFELINFRGLATNSPLLNYQSFNFPSPPACTMIKLADASLCSYDKRLSVGEDNDFLYCCLKGKSYIVLDQILYYYEEVGVLSKSKLINYQFLKLNKIIIKTSGIYRIKLFSKEIVRTLIKIPAILVLGPEYISKRRGNTANLEQIKEFNQIVSKLKKQ